MIRLVLVALLIPACASAQTSSRVVDVRAGGLVSVQPKGYESPSSPYLDNALDGVVAGASVSFNVAAENAPMLTIELSSTTSMSATQRGRFIIGQGPIKARHRDTLLSILGGVRVGQRTTLEVKGGLSLLFGTPQREAFEYDDPGGIVGFAGGADIVAPVTARVSIVPFARYTYANRGDDALYFGLGTHIVRAGVAVAFAIR